MTLPIIFRPAAQAEFTEAAEWYEAHAASLGTQFTSAVRGVTQQVANDPLRYAVEYKDVREAPVPGFPFCVYYRVRANRLVVLSVFHTSRDPPVWQSRA